MVVAAQCDVVWADMAEPVGSGPGRRRPVVVVQGDEVNASGISTVIVVPLTSNMKWSSAFGNVVLPAEATGLPKDSVANVSQIVAIDRELLGERVGHVSDNTLVTILAGIDVVLGRI